MTKHEISAFLITKPENIYYLTGFDCGIDGRVLLTETDIYIFTDRRYETQAANECEFASIIIENAGRWDSLYEKLSAYKFIGAECNDISWQKYLEISANCIGQIKPCLNLVEQLRECKDEIELEIIRQAAAISDDVFTDIIPQIYAGVTEIETAAAISNIYRQHGILKESFDTIVLAGLNSALPHGKPGPTQIRNNDFLTIDMGGIWQHYVSDMTRSIVIGKPSQRFIDIYKIVLEAQLLGLSLVKPGVSCNEIDSRIRGFFTKFGMQDNFVHGTGHGIGLEIHEEPRISLNSRQVLKENMVVTIEPGLYFPGWGGIRIEDSVIVTRKGYEIITKTSKELTII